MSYNIRLRRQIVFEAWDQLYSSVRLIIFQTKTKGANYRRVLSRRVCDHTSRRGSIRVTRTGVCYLVFLHSESSKQMARQAGHPNIIYCVGNIVSRSCHAASTHIFLLVENNMSVGSRHPSVEKLARVAFKTYFMELGDGLAGTGYRIYIQIILYSDPAGTARRSFLASC